MKKIKQIHKKQPKLTYKQTIDFLDNFSKLVHHQDTPTQLISLRVPQNVLDSFKVKAKMHDLKYQSQIVKLMRQWCSS